MKGFEEDNIIDYRGYRICRNTKTVWHRNPISGHEWSTYEDVNSCCVIGKFSFANDLYRSLKSAKEHVDFLVDVCGEFKVFRSQREVDKARRLGLGEFEVQGVLEDG